MFQVLLGRGIPELKGFHSLWASSPESPLPEEEKSKYCVFATRRTCENSPFAQHQAQGHLPNHNPSPLAHGQDLGHIQPYGRKAPLQEEAVSRLKHLKYIYIYILTIKLQGCLFFFSNYFPSRLHTVIYSVYLGNHCMGKMAE